MTRPASRPIAPPAPPRPRKAVRKEPPAPVSSEDFPSGATVEFLFRGRPLRASVLSIDAEAGELVLFDLRQRQVLRMPPHKVKLVEQPEAPPPQGQIKPAQPAPEAEPLDVTSRDEPEPEPVEPEAAPTSAAPVRPLPLPDELSGEPPSGPGSDGEPAQDPAAPLRLVPEPAAPAQAPDEEGPQQ